jgi:holo-[acyl-carrier protein] synthase
MIHGIGTDIVKIARVEAALGRHGEHFAARILGAEELAVFHTRYKANAWRGVRYLATRFAAKEAFAKATGFGMRMPMCWHAMQALNGPQGEPTAVCSGALKEFMDNKQLSAKLSISDEAEYALAFVILEQT